MNNKKHITISILVLSTLFVAPHFLSFFHKNIPETNIHNKISVVNEFDNLSLIAKAIFVYDIKKDKILFAKNEEMQLPLASLTKVMTALVAIENTQNNTVVSISDEVLDTEGDSGFTAGEIWDLKKIIDFTLVESSNDGASAIASVIGSDALSAQNENTFINLMNKKAKELDLPQTYFLNESGLDRSEDFAGSYGSAKDMAFLFSFVIKKHPNLLEATAYDFFEVNSRDASYLAENTNQIVGQIPGIIASKTGFTDLAGGNLVVVFEAGPMRPIAISVLGSTVEDRFSDIEKLVSASLLAIQN